MKLEQLNQDYDRIEAAIRYLEKNLSRQPSLDQIAASANLSEFHFQRIFSRWVGISPKRFLQYLTKEYAKTLLKRSTNILDTTYETGLSSPSRLHDLFVTCEAVTPGEYRRLGAGLQIEFGIHPSPFGECLLAVTQRGICALYFIGTRSHAQLIQDLKTLWPNAQLSHKPEETRPIVERVFTFDRNQPPAPLHLYVKGSNFQIKVWEALLKIPLGNVASYSDIARHIGLPQAARAVGNAIGQNPIPFLIPCHRVIRKMGDFGNYGSGPARKKAMLGWEAVQAQSES